MELYNFSKKNKHVKIVTRSVPEIIGKDFKLHDISIKSYGPDDELYNKYENLRKNIARGNTILEYPGSNEKQEFILVIRGFKKFTGYDKFDEDDVLNHDYKLYLSEQPENDTELYCMEKVNGKAGHISCINLLGQDFVFCGSKNVHIILRRDHLLEDIALYPDKESHSIAKDIAKLVTTMPSTFFDYLKENNWTANIEFISVKNEHIVDYKNKDDTYKFLCYTPNNTDLLTIDPIESLNHAKSIGIPMVDYKVIKYSKLGQYISELRDQENSEGIVAYMVNPNTRKTIGLIKLKSKWYVLIRAIREKIKKWNINQISKRIDDIREWLSLTDEETKYWKNEGVLFAKWIKNGIDLDLFDNSDILNHYATLWVKFTKEMKDNDFRVKISEKNLTNNPIIIFCSPCPGVGKSTLARALSYLLNGIWINQDECGGVAKKFHAEIKKNINRSNQLIIDKCLHAPKHRASFVNQFPNQDFVWISLILPDKKDILEIAKERIEKRGSNHKSLTSENPDLMKIVNMFLRMWKPVKTEEFKEIENFKEKRFCVGEIPITMTSYEQICEILKFLNTFENYNLNFSTEEIHQSLERSKKDEQNINKRKLYWKLSILDKNHIYWKNTIKHFLEESNHMEYEKNYQNLIYEKKGEPHVTMLFIKPERKENSYDEKEKEILNECLPLYNKYMTIFSTHVVFNEKCICLRVKKTFPTYNKYPHITLALSKDVKPYYANYMLENMEKEGAIEYVGRFPFRAIVN